VQLQKPRFQKQEAEQLFAGEERDNNHAKRLFPAKHARGMS